MGSNLVRLLFIVGSTLDRSRIVGSIFFSKSPTAQTLLVPKAAQSTMVGSNLLISRVPGLVFFHHCCVVISKFFHHIVGSTSVHLKVEQSILEVCASQLTLVPSVVTLKEAIKLINPKLINANNTHPMMYIRLLVVSLTSAPLDASMIYMMPL